ncbi:MAG: SprT-like domain-containing protein [Paludibacteraceae bacterium]
MIADKEYIEAKFEEYNRLYFGGMLPPIPVRLSNAKGFLGKVCYRKTKSSLFSRARNTDFVLRINTRIDLPEEVVEDTILHEMIHYAIAYRQLQDSSAHGRLFRAEMARINQAGGRHIGISHRLTDEQQWQAVGHKRVRIVCVVGFADGRTGVKVVPKQIRHILQFHRQAQAHFDLRTINWYMTEDGYFAKYPSSSALRIYLVSDTQELESALASARRLLCDGRQVRQEANSGNSLWW